MSVNQLHLLECDAQLDQAIQFVAARSPHWASPRTIFLTGATGFLGTYFLEELLRTTNAQICCLLRSAQLEEEHQHLQ